MAHLTAEDVSGWPKDKVERELRERLADVEQIRHSNGDTLVGLKGADADRVGEHMKSTNALGARLDDIRADEKTATHFERLADYMNSPDPDQPARHPAGTSAAGGDSRPAADVGGMFVQSDAWKAYIDRGQLNKPVQVPTEALFGSAYNSIGAIPNDGARRQAALFDSTGFGSRPDYRDDRLVDTLYQQNNISNLMPQGTTDSDTIQYPVETVTATGAAEVAEGATKPEAQISFADVTEPIRTIAVLLPMTNRALRNSSFLRAYINARLRLFVQMREDAELLNGNGTAPNLRGILNRSGINTATSYSIGGANPDQALIDSVFKASMRVRDAFLEPDAVVMKPSTWEIAALTKDANRNYIVGGPGVAAPQRLWGLPVVLNANMPAQAATNKPVLVGAFGMSAMVIRRDGLQLALSDSHSTFFAENKVMLRAEEEVALAVFRPAGFAAVTSAV